MKSKDTRIGGAYMTLYGSNTIRQSIIKNKEFLDYVCVIHQRKPIFENSVCPDEEIMFKELLKLKKEKYIDDLVICEKRSSENIESYVLRKRNLGLKLCKKHACNYIVPLDADEIYLKEVKRIVAKNNYDTYYAKIKTYYCDPKLCYDDNYFVPFAYKIDDRKFEISYNNSVIVDPLRNMKEKKFAILNNQYMHHYSINKEILKMKMNDNIGKLNNKAVMDMWNYMLAFVEVEFNGTKALIFDHSLKTKYVDLSLNENSPWVMHEDNK